MRNSRPAFTLVEILISVLILSSSVVFTLKIYSDNKAHIVYISERNKLSLQDSLYVGSSVFKYHKDNKSAYDIIEADFKIQELESRALLKKSTRDIFIPEEIKIAPPPDTPGPTATINEVLLKGSHSSRYYHIKIDTF